MTVLPIYVAPHPVLKKVAEPVAKVSDAEKKLIDDMLDTMYINDGIGLAAPQVGVSKRILVIDLEQNLDAENPLDRRGNPRVFINPEIIWQSPEIRCYKEGCLSIPDQYAEVERPDRVKVKFLDYDGNVQELEADNLLSTALQHEIDHLNGILFTDHLSKLKREMVMKKLQKFIKTYDLSESHITI